MALLQYLGRPQIGQNWGFKPGMISAYPYCAMVNRVIKNTLDPFIVDTPVETIHDVLKHEYKGQTYEDICLARAEYFRSLPNKKFIMWSGGIDSTLVVISFLKTHSKQELENVNIVASSESINEFPEFWNDIVSHFKGRIHSSHFHIEKYLKQGIVVTGEFGDQSMGSDVIKLISTKYGEEALFEPFEKIMPHHYTDSYGYNTFVETYKPTVEYSLYPIKTVYDWTWWINFTNKWNSVKYRLLQVQGWEDAKTNFKNMHHFFDTIDFQLWSMNSPHLKIKDTLQSYKFHAKDLIIEYTGYTNYVKKPKIGSLGRIWSVKSIHVGIDTEFNFLSNEDLKRYVNK